MMTSIDLDDSFSRVLGRSILSGSFGGLVVIDSGVLVEGVVVYVGSPSKLADVTLRVIARK
jgi:hypothetical protein